MTRRETIKSLQQRNSELITKIRNNEHDIRRVFRSMMEEATTPQLIEAIMELPTNLVEKIVNRLYADPN